MKIDRLKDNHPVCASCGEPVRSPSSGMAAKDSDILCDKCYMHALAPDHRIQGMELFD